MGVLLAAPALPAAAQTMVFGGSTAPDVVVNENVLDALGPPSTLPGLMRQENAGMVTPSGLRPFSLHPPRARRTVAARKPKPTATRQQEQAQAQTQPSTQEASPVAETAIPLGKSKRAAGSKSSSGSAPVTADVGAATTPPRATLPRAQPTQTASASTSAPPPAPAPAAAPPATPTGPVNSLVRRYPAGTGAAMLAASNPPPAPPPQPSPPPATSTPPSSSTSASSSSTTPPAASASAASPPPAPTPAPSAQPAATPPAPAPAAAAAPPAPPPAPAPSSQVAALPPGGGLPALPAQVAFAANVTDLPDQAKSTLDKVITAMKADDQIRIQLVAYASGLPDQSSLARRVSLSRALSVRTYLVEQGVKSVRIDVRAMGNRPDLPGPQDRVDIVTIDR